MGAGTLYFSSPGNLAFERTAKWCRKLYSRVLVCVSVCVLVTQLCPNLCNPMDCSLPGSTVHAILQARILEWVAIPFTRGFPQPRNWTRVSCTVGRFFTEPSGKPTLSSMRSKLITYTGFLKLWYENAPFYVFHTPASQLPHSGHILGKDVSS